MASGCALPTRNTASRQGRPPSSMKATDCSAAAGSPRPCPPSRACRMPRPHSAGILLFRRSSSETEVLLIKPGGPFWRNKDAGAWMIPKGAVEAGETSLEAALREFEEETGTAVVGEPVPLAKVRQSGGKWVEAFAAEGDLDCAAVRSNEFELEWPPRSGRL